MAGLTLLDVYSFDTSAIINGRRDIFKPNTFGSIWSAIEGMVGNGQVIAIDEVRNELKRKSDDAYRWARTCRGLFVPLDRDVQMATRRVLAAHPRLMGIGGPRNGADPFVIGLAIARGGSVVTQETPRTIIKPRIPDVCEALEVPCMTLPEFVDSQGWQLQMAGD